MQALLSAAIDIALAILFGLLLIQNHIAIDSKAKTVKINKVCTSLLSLVALAYLIAGTIEITQSNLAGLASAVLAVSKLTSFGQMATLVFITSLVLWLITFTRPSQYKYLYIFGILVLAYAKAAIGHAADAGLISLAVFNHSLHILAGSAWAGSIAAAILLLPQWRQYDLKTSKALADRLSAIATVAVPVVIICGVFDSIRTLSGGHNIWHSEYFITLAIKVSLVLIAIVMGLINRWYWLPKMTNAQGNYGFIKTITTESITLLMILIAAGQLGFTMLPS